MTGLMTNAAVPAGAPATVDVNWTLFQSVYSAVDLPVVNAVNGVLDALAAYLNPMMIAMLTAYIMLAGFRMALAPNGAPMQAMMRTLFVARSSSLWSAMLATSISGSERCSSPQSPMRSGRQSMVHSVLVGCPSTAVLNSMRFGMLPIRLV
jgi:hypothetical protein